jgi:hypothetical protein
LRFPYSNIARFLRAHRLFLDNDSNAWIVELRERLHCLLVRSINNYDNVDGSPRLVERAAHCSSHNARATSGRNNDANNLSHGNLCHCNLL